ncbi:MULTISPECIES: GNAT family N-acetyltransferase [unclassified Streptomyces]|uniref:GNAT family N-acetyltransferase n=1 Tax=unclassified Streptomyces TaxID=2593676 RepID=UPI002E2C05D7|nr:GNAT family N-acetyltransferase [Streptomyces sp. NBC_01429]
MKIQTVSYAHPDAVDLGDQAQAEYTRRYGSGDVTPLRPAYFDPPNGLYLLGYDADAPVASGGWRAQDDGDEGYARGDAELKRMFVVPAARGRGLSRRILAALEEDAREAGRVRMVLETGELLTEAVALYTSSGYVPTDGFGTYRGDPDSRFFEKAL